MSFSSGLAAEDAIIRGVLAVGDHVILANDMYGGSYRLFARVHKAWGIDFTIVDLNDEAALEVAFIEGKTKMVLFFKDPFSSHAHESDVNILLGVWDMHIVP